MLGASNIRSCRIRLCWSIRLACASSTSFPNSGRVRAIARTVDPFVDDRRKRVEIRPHKKGLARSVAEILVIGVDHCPHRRYADGHRSDDQIAQALYALVRLQARIAENCARDA